MGIDIGGERYCPSICLEGLRKTMNISVRYIPNANQMHYANLLSMGVIEYSRLPITRVGWGIYFPG
jgi:hypothetical protein